MAKKLTDGQKKARACARAAMQEVIRRVDELACRRDATEFTAYFHLSCLTRPKPNTTMDYPVFSGAITRR